jgi:hypothetical protein
MNGMTPLEKLISSTTIPASHISHFPVFILEDLVKVWGGTDVQDHYLF